jgi:predicted nucleic acid-binding protein
MFRPSSEICERAVSMIFDTDVLIWFFRGNQAAADLLDGQAERAVSIVSVMELHQGARSHQESRAIRRFLQDNNLRVIAINEAISHLAATLVEDHALKDGLRVADALIGATARETGSILATGNVRHMRCIPALELKAFRSNS